MNTVNFLTLVHSTVKKKKKLSFEPVTVLIFLTAVTRQTSGGYDFQTTPCTGCQSESCEFCFVLFFTAM